MATRRWRGTAPARAEVKTAQVTAYDAATTYILTINNKTVSVIAQGSVNATASALATAWNALSATTYPEFAEVTASSNTDTVTLTHDTAGVPFTVTSSVSGGTGTFGAVSTTTTAQGPNCFNTAANWTGNTVPTTGDDIYLENSDVALLYDLDQSAITPNSFYRAASYTGAIGLPDKNEDGDYYEYRTTFLTFNGCTTVNLGYGEGTGPGRERLAFGTGQIAANIYSTGSSLDSGYPATLLKGSNAANTLELLKGDVGAALFADETMTIATLRVGHGGNAAGDARFWGGAGLTTTTLNMGGGSVTLENAPTTITKTAGELFLKAGNTTTFSHYGGTAYPLGTGTITTYHGADGSKLDFSRDLSARTLTTTNLYKGSEIYDPFATVTFTNGIVLVRCQVEDVTLDVGFNRTLSIS